MNINDPFGRLERRHQISYEAVRDSLSRNQVDTAEAARKIIRDTKIRALKFLVAGALLASITCLLVPGALPVVAAVGLLGGAWLISWTVNGERYIKRYIDEELGGRPGGKGSR